jgi:hypothetical protein
MTTAILGATGRGERCRAVERRLEDLQAGGLIAREWAILAGENERSTTVLESLIGHAPRSVSTFLHDHRDLFI